MSKEVFHDLAQVTDFAIGRMDEIKGTLERGGYQALALGFEEELNRKELAMRAEEMSSMRQTSKKKFGLRSGRVCTLPGLAPVSYTHLTLPTN